LCYLRKGEPTLPENNYPVNYLNIFGGRFLHRTSYDKLGTTRDKTKEVPLLKKVPV
jgi:hypothetical protein